MFCVVGVVHSMVEPVFQGKASGFAEDLQQWQRTREGGSQSQRAREKGLQWGPSPAPVDIEFC